MNSNAVSGTRALKEVEQFTNLGARHAGTPGAQRAALYLERRLKEMDIETQVAEFVDKTPDGLVTFRNVIAMVPGFSDKRIVLLSHYDTKRGLGPSYVGANDSGSSTGLLLELARVLAASDEFYYTVVLAFVDGEECMDDYGDHDGLHGSRHLCKTLTEQEGHGEIRAAIVLDLVGDQDMTITIPRNVTMDLASCLFQAARSEGVRSAFSLAPYGMTDDHVPFLRAGLPSLLLIDFEFGSEPGKNDYWHTCRDTLDKLSAQTLESVGRVTIRLLNQLAERELH